MFLKHYLSDVLGQMRTEITGCVSNLTFKEGDWGIKHGTLAQFHVGIVYSTALPAAEHVYWWTCSWTCLSNTYMINALAWRNLHSHEYKQEIGGGLSPLTLAVLLQLYRMASSPKAVPACISPSSFPFWMTSSKPSAVVQKHQTVEP